MKLICYRTFTVLFFVLLSFYSTRIVTAEDRKPNILIILTDDQCFDQIDFYNSLPDKQSEYTCLMNLYQPRNRRVFTPTIDSLAAGGICFTNANASCPVCGPSRYSILTGRYAQRNQSGFVPQNHFYRIENTNVNLERINNCYEDASLTGKNIQTLLGENGYKTGVVGKWHLDTKWQNEYDVPDYPGDADPKTHAEVNEAMRQKHEMFCHHISNTFNWDYANNLYEANLKELNNEFLNVHNIDWTVDGAYQFLDKFAEGGENAGDPFFLYFSTTLHHGPNVENIEEQFNVDPGYTGAGYRSEPFDLPYTREEIKVKLEEEGFPENSVAYTWLDYAVNALISKLKEIGEYDNTIIIYNSDHGIERNGKATAFNHGMLTPTFVSWNKHIVNPGICDELVSNCAFAPTIFDYAGVSVPAEYVLDGTSLRPVVEGDLKHVLHSELFGEFGYARTVKTKEWQYIAVRYPENVQAQIDAGNKFESYEGMDGMMDYPYLCYNSHLGHYGMIDNPNYFHLDHLYKIPEDIMCDNNLLYADGNPISEDDLDPEIKSIKEELKSKLSTHLSGYYRPFGELSDIFAVISNCNSLSGWESGNVLRKNTSQMKEGTSCLEFEGNHPLWFEKKLESPLYVDALESNGSLDMWIYISDILQLKPKGYISLSSAGMAGTDEYLWETDQMNLLNGWNHLNLRLQDAVKNGNPDLRAICYFGIYQEVKNSVKVRLDFIQFTREAFNEAPGIAGNPYPADGDSAVDVTGELNWVRGAGAEYHTIYFGTSNPPEFVTQIKSSAENISFSPGKLKEGESYYWRIDEVNQSGIREGELWSFTVASKNNDYVLLDACDDSGNWNSANSLSTDTNEKETGYASLRAEGMQTRWFNRIFNPAVNSYADDSTAYLDLWLYVSDVSAFSGGGQIEISSSGKPDLDEYSWSPGALSLQNGWNDLHLKISEAAKMGTPDLSAINYFRMYQVVNKTVILRIDQIRFSGNLSVPPEVPLNITGKSCSNRICIYWEADEDKDRAGFNVYRSTVPSGGFKKLNESPVSGLSYSDSTIYDFRTYYYYVTAISVKGIESEPGMVVSARLEKSTEIGPLTPRILKIYPNPVKGSMIHIELNSIPVNGKVMVRSVNGRLCLEESLRGKHTVLNIDKFPAGLYFLTLYCEGYTEILKVSIL